MTAKFFNAEDGSITDFTNKPFINGFDEPSYLSRIGTTSNPILFYQRGIPNPTQEVDEDNDMYYCVKIKRNDIEYGYVYDIGCSNCLFSGGTVSLSTFTLTPTPATPTPTPTTGGGVTNTPTPTLTPTITPTVTSTPTPTPTATEISGPIAVWEYGTSASHSRSLPGTNPSFIEETGTLTVSNGTMIFKVTSSKPFNYDNISIAYLEVSGVGNISIQAESGQSSVISSSQLTVPVGTYTYILRVTLEVKAPLTQGLAYSTINEV
jgi:hypothetical protein